MKKQKTSQDINLPTNLIPLGTQNTNHTTSKTNKVKERQTVMGI